MDNKLAHDILNHISKGIGGLEDIKTLLKKGDISIKDEHIVSVVYELKEQGCIQNLSSGHPKTYVLTGKECTNYYKKLVEDETNKNNEESETRDLQRRKLKIDVELGEKVLKTYKFTRIAALFSFISAILLLALKLLEVLGISLK
ncbi:MAG: hypothetical protein ACT4OJ_10795 [Bacteroidota bacterium]